MKMKICIPLLVAVLTLNGIALAEDGGHRRHHAAGDVAGSRMLRAVADPDRMVERMTRHLQLDETQQQELKNVLLAAQPQLLALRDKAEAHREAMAALTSSDDDYSARLQNLAAESGQLATEKTLLLSQLRTDIHSTLTPEQQQKLSEGREHRRKQFRKGRREAANEGEI